MPPVVRKLQSADVTDIGRAIADAPSSLETGLGVLDTGVVLGRASVDLVAVDAEKSLVLVYVGTADEALLLRLVDTCSWSQEHPELLQRLYPQAQILSRRPMLRVIVVAERHHDPFLRKLRQLDIPRIDCLECRRIEVDGSAAVYFDPVAEIRKTPARDLAPSIHPLPREAGVATEQGSPAGAPADRGARQYVFTEASKQSGLSVRSESGNGDRAHQEEEWQALLRQLRAPCDGVVSPFWRRFLDNLAQTPTNAANGSPALAGSMRPSFFIPRHPAARGGFR